MSYGDSLSKKDWGTLQFAPFWVFDLVARAGDNEIDRGEQKTLHEIVRNSVTYQNDLVRKILAYINADFDKLLSACKVDARKAVDGLKEVAQIVETSAPKDVKMFKVYMFVIGYKIAASPGFLGVKKKVRLEEIKALDEICKIFQFTQKELKYAISLVGEDNPDELEASFKNWKAKV
ncbi:hypothetical protein WDW89_20725 [Deltaproteobacteria bacterium TL4]